jgi:MoaA/NifB/PqqE/SkfB family radical SAM enzyme
METAPLIDQTLKRIIVEPTNLCNLDCSMCIRRTWNSPGGQMSSTIFAALLKDLRGFWPTPEIFFGGYGEPLSHPHIIQMIQEVKGTGARAEMVSNGTLLTPQMMQDLISSGLDKIWLSLDNSHQDSIQEGQGVQSKPTVIQKMEELIRLKKELEEGPELGLVIVLSRGSPDQTLKHIQQGIKIGLRSFFFTHLEAYSKDMAHETPYGPEDLRRLDSWQARQAELLKELEELAEGITIEGVLGNTSPHCPFAERGEIVLRWDGEICPCLPLLYDHASFVGLWEHKITSHSQGHIQRSSIHQAWTNAENLILRERLLGKEFSPCLSCRDCWLSEDNQLDCMGYEHPTCGGCLWAEGFIACP